MLLRQYPFHLKLAIDKTSKVSTNQPKHVFTSIAGLNNRTVPYSLVALSSLFSEVENLDVVLPCP